MVDRSQVEVDNAPAPATDSATWLGLDPLDLRSKQAGTALRVEAAGNSAMAGGVKNAPRLAHEHGYRLEKLVRIVEGVE